MDVVEADAPCDARKATPARQITGPKARDLGVVAPPGSESAARRQGLPRNLGDLDVPRVSAERRCEGNETSPGCREVGAPQYEP
jgi:hypothetical protein